MSEILVLLTLLGVATIASQRGAAMRVVNIITTPLLLAIGFLMSSRGLNFLHDSTSDGLLPAVRVGAAWLAVLVGLRAARPIAKLAFWRRASWTFVVCLLTWAALSGGIYGLLLLVEATLGSLPFNDQALIGIAILLGGIMTGSGYEHGDDSETHPTKTPFVIFLSRHDEVTGALAILVALVLWPLEPSVAPIYSDLWYAAAVVVGLGLTLAVANNLIGVVNRGDNSAALISMLGLSVFASGLSTSMHLPDAAIAFFFGSFLACSPQAHLQLEQGLLATERPVRMAVLMLVGVYLGFTWQAVLVGLAIAFVRLLIKSLVRPLVDRGRAAAEEFPTGAFLSSSGLAIPFALSFAMMRPDGLRESFILCVVCVAVSASDLFTFAFWKRPDQVEEYEQPGEGNTEPLGPAATEVTP